MSEQQCHHDTPLGDSEPGDDQRYGSLTPTQETLSPFTQPLANHYTQGLPDAYPRSTPGAINANAPNKFAPPFQDQYEDLSNPYTYQYGRPRQNFYLEDRTNPYARFPSPNQAQTAPYAYAQPSLESHASQRLGPYFLRGSQTASFRGNPPMQWQPQRHRVIEIHHHHFISECPGLIRQVVRVKKEVKERWELEEQNVGEDNFAYPDLNEAIDPDLLADGSIPVNSHQQNIWNRLQTCDIPLPSIETNDYYNPIRSIKTEKFRNGAVRPPHRLLRPTRDDAEGQGRSSVGPIRRKSRANRDIRPIPYRKRQDQDAPPVTELTRGMLAGFRVKEANTSQGPARILPTNFKEAVFVIQRWFSNTWMSKLAILTAVFDEAENLRYDRLRQMHSTAKQKGSTEYNRVYKEHTFEELYKYVDLAESFLDKADAQGVKLYLRSSEYEQNVETKNNHPASHRYTDVELLHLVLLRTCYDRLNSREVHLVLTKLFPGLATTCTGLGERYRRMGRDADKILEDVVILDRPERFVKWSAELEALADAADEVGIDLNNSL